MHDHDITRYMNMKVFLCMFMTTVIKCHLLSYVIFNTKMTLFEMSLLWVRGKGRGRVRSNNGIFALKILKNN